MTTVDFEEYKDSYREDVQRAIGFIGQDLDFYTEIKADHIAAAAARYFGSRKSLKVLDVGCGVGETDRFLRRHFSEIHGVDVAPGVIEQAARHNPSVHYQCYDGKRLPFDDGTFDLAFTICVVQCVPSPQWGGFVAEMRRVVKKGGLVFIFEHNPLNPLTRRVVARCRMNDGLPLLRKKLVKQLMEEAQLEVVEDPYILFFPWKGRFFRKSERALLRKIPLGAQYYVVGKK